MSMHLQTSKEMLNETSSQIQNIPRYMEADNGSQIECSQEVYGGWWKTRSKMEKKLVVLSSFLFLLSFCLVIGLGVVASQGARQKPSVSGKTTLTEPAMQHTVTSFITPSIATAEEESSSTVASTDEIVSETEDGSNKITGSRGDAKTAGLPGTADASPTSITTDVSTFIVANDSTTSATDSSSTHDEIVKPTEPATFPTN